MLTEFSDNTSKVNPFESKVEAICLGCKSTVNIPKNNLQDQINCNTCGFKFYVNKSNLILKPEAFKKQKKYEAKSKSARKQIAYPFYFTRHGKDQSQKATLKKITTKDLIFSTFTPILPNANISMIIKDKKFIAKVDKIKQRKIQEQDEEKIEFEVLATLVTVISILDKKEKKKSIFA